MQNRPVRFGVRRCWRTERELRTPIKVEPPRRHCRRVGWAGWRGPLWFSTSGRRSKAAPGGSRSRPRLRICFPAQADRFRRNLNHRQQPPASQLCEKCLGAYQPMADLIPPRRHQRHRLLRCELRTTLMYHEVERSPRRSLVRAPNPITRPRSLHQVTQRPRSDTNDHRDSLSQGKGQRRWQNSAANACRGRSSSVASVLLGCAA